MQNIVVVYDIPNDKTRRIIGEVLEGFGKRVNRSVFECHIKNATQRKKLEHALAHEINPKVDSLRIYTVCANCKQTSTALGKEPKPFDRSGVYFF